MIHTFDLRVYYEDTDMAGIVYYANYLKYLERGRSEAVRAMRIDQTRMRDDLGIVFAVRRVEIDYIRPGKFEDILRVSTRTTDVGAASFDVAQDIHCGETHLIHADIKIALISLEGKVVRFPADMRDKFLATLT